MSNFVEDSDLDFNEDNEDFNDVNQLLYGSEAELKDNQSIKSNNDRIDTSSDKSYNKLKDKRSNDKNIEKRFHTINEISKNKKRSDQILNNSSKHSIDSNLNKKLNPFENRIERNDYKTKQKSSKSSDHRKSDPIPVVSKYKSCDTKTNENIKLDKNLKQQSLQLVSKSQSKDSKRSDEKKKNMREISKKSSKDFNKSYSESEVKSREMKDLKSKSENNTKSNFSEYIWDPIQSFAESKHNSLFASNIKTYEDLSPVLFESNTSEENISNNQLVAENDLNDKNCEQLSQQSMSYSDKYDPNCICNPCLVVLTKYSDRYITRAIDGMIDFNPSVTEESDSDIEIIFDSNKLIRSLEIDLNDELPQISYDFESEESKTKPQKEIEFKNLTKSIETKNLGKLNLSESSSEGEPNQNITPFLQLLGKELVFEEHIKGLAKTETKTNRKERKKKSKQSSSPKTSKKDSIDSQTKKKRKTIQLSKRLIDSTSDSSENKSIFDNSIITTNNNEINESISQKPIKRKISESVGKRNSKKKQTKITSSPLSYNNQEVMTNEDIQRIVNVLPNNEITKGFQFKCNFCEFVSEEELDLILHKTQHSFNGKEEVLLKCEVCPSIFCSKQSLEEHKLEAHTLLNLNPSLYDCEKCPQFSFSSVEELDRHLISSHIIITNSSEIICDLCEAFISYDINQMINHLTNKHRFYTCGQGSHLQTIESETQSLPIECQKTFECKYCDFKSNCFEVLVEHKHITHAIDWTVDGRNKCGLCPTVFVCEDTTQILQHLTSHSINFSYFECKLCLKKYQNLNQLKIHYTKQHLDSNQINDCFDKYITNLDQLFQEVRQQLTKSKEVIKKFSNETENAVQELIGEEFFGDNNQMDLLSTALDFAGISTNDSGEALHLIPTQEIINPWKMNNDLEDNEFFQF